MVTTSILPYRHPTLRALLISVLGGLLAAGAGCSNSERQGFATPEAGAAAMTSALRAQDAETLRRILGPESESVLSSGDEVADRHDREAFLAAYDHKHDVVTWDDGTATIVVGDADWPMPVPLVQASGQWRFDTDRGRDEIVARRIGRNELGAIETCRAIVDAQQEFRQGAGCYAIKFLSDLQSRNGLYWPTQPGEPESPLGALIAEAAAEGYAKKGNTQGPRPYHGYCYRILTAAGPSAPGGQRDYLSNNRLEGGFAVVAYPVSYGDSGIMTFMVCHDGIVYQRDLGSATASKAAAMRSFDPDAGWTVEAPTAQTAQE